MPSRLPACLLPIALLAAGPAAAQFQSESYKFLTAVREGKGDDVIAALNKPGNTMINTRDVTSGETALHITVKRGDALYTRFMIEKGADVNARDGHGDTPLMLAVQGGYDSLIPILTDAGANPNLGNAQGETPLIIAVHRRDGDMIRLLLKAGGDPDQTDSLAGKSARDYAMADTRSTMIARLFADTPKKPKRAVAGPKL
jgi:ankyrin repeat protein